MSKFIEKQQLLSNVNTRNQSQISFLKETIDSKILDTLDST